MPMSNSPSVGERAVKSSAEANRCRNNKVEIFDAESQSPTNSVAGFARRIGKCSKSIEQWLIKYSFERRGIQRVEPHETHVVTWISYLQAFVLWFSINLAAQNATLGMLAPVIFKLSFKDASICAVIGSAIGSVAVAYIAPFGPKSGLRSMVFARYTFGWWPTRLLVILNLVVLLGYSIIGLVVAGQILSAVSTNNRLSIAVGVVIVAIICWVTSTLGIKVFLAYERYAFLPQLVVMSILYGVSASSYDLNTHSEGNSRTVIGNRISFLSLCLSAAITYAGGAADFFVYYSPSTRKFPLFIASFLGLLLSFTLSIILGVGLASAIPHRESFAAAYDKSQGALLLAGLEPLHGFGKFCGVILAMGLIANTVPPTYVSGINFQILGSAPEKIPRFIWNTIGVIICTVCALAGRDSLSEIFRNFLALMGYWVVIWIAITIEEQIIFRRARGSDWMAWNNQSQLPVGIAALIAFLIGWAGAILCMAQVWYIGPIASLVGDYGADLGNYVSFAWAALVYPPLRWLELRKVGR